MRQELEEIPERQRRRAEELEEKERRETDEHFKALLRKQRELIAGMFEDRGRWLRESAQDRFARCWPREALPADILPGR